MECVDIVVVGGGPAGSVAAIEAAANDAAVVVIEKGVPRADRDHLGPDSTDAAGLLNYWIDMMEIDPESLPDGIVLQELDGAEFFGPTERLVLQDTGISSTYPHFGVTYDRRRFDDWLADQAIENGAEYRVGTAVQSVQTTLKNGPTHTVTLRDGTTIESEYVILADGPQRGITLRVLDQFLPENRAVESLSPRTANHIAYQEYRRFPEELFEPTRLKFWWGAIPGHTAYPWVFPNDGTVARVGLTMPIGLDLSMIRNREAYRLIRTEDEQIPDGRTLIERLLEMVYGDEYDISEFPLVKNRGKQEGTETYPISSTRPIDSPTHAGIAVTGGAMGATSAFHEGGAHVAVQTGRIAGKLAAKGNLQAYNTAWKDTIGSEILRNVAFAWLVNEFEPTDWDRAFRVANRLLALQRTDGITVMNGVRAAGLMGAKLAFGYRARKYWLQDGRYAQIRESDYSYSPS